MPGGSKSGGGHLAFGQWMTCPHDTHIAVPEQRLRAHLGADGAVHHAGFQIDGAVAQRAAVLVQLVQKVQTNVRRLLGKARQQPSPKFSTKPSLDRSVKVRASCRRSGLPAGRRAAWASWTSWPMASRNSSARGDATRPRPARTSSGSPVASRSRASARLIAEGLRCRRRAAPATLPSASSTSRVNSKFRSGRVTLWLRALGFDRACNAPVECKSCAFRNLGPMTIFWACARSAVVRAKP